MEEIINGKKIAEDIKNSLKDKVKGLTLAVILVGEDPSSLTYIKQKEKLCRELDVNFKIYNLSEDTHEKKLIELLKSLNEDIKINGILVQLPLPKHIYRDNVLKEISPKKDVDGFNSNLLPCTPKAILNILEKEEISLENKKIVVVGHGFTVGQPLSRILKNKGYNVTICNSKTLNLKEITKQADVLITAVGKPNLITKDMVKKGAVIIDAGISRINNKVVGDVDFESVKEIASKITPVPGGVGPVTVAMVLENLLTLKNKS